jgi:Zn-dependent protease with chaperone function/Tfp pilus assembly protein PilE
MNDLVYAKERTLGKITLVLGVIIWLALLIGTVGVILIGLLIGFVIYVIAHSAFIAYIRGNGVELSEEQFPDLYAQFVNCCNRLGIEKRPKAYVLNGQGSLNAFATKFLGNEFVVLYSDVVDAMAEHHDGVQFYIGHELGHLRMKHLQGKFLRWPVLWLPLIGAAYSRSRESTCDLHGRACSNSPEAAAQSIAALSAGSTRWKTINLVAYQNAQLPYTGGFWASFHELTAAYPWLVKRVARVMNNEQAMPKRKPLAYLLAAFVPYAGPQGGVLGLLITIYIVGIMAAIAVPAYQDYTVKAKISMVLNEVAPIEAALGNYYQQNQKVPESLASVNVPEQLNGNVPITFNTKNMIVTVLLPQGELLLVPSVDDEQQVTWKCTNGEHLKPTALPPSCYASQNH